MKKNVSQGSTSSAPLKNTSPASMKKDIDEYNKGKFDPEQLFVKGSAARTALLEGRIKFPLEWAKHSVYYPGIIDTKGLSSTKFLHRILVVDEEFAWEAYNNDCIEISTDTLYECIDICNDVSVNIALDMLDKYDEIPVGLHWKRSISDCLALVMLREFTDKTKRIAKELIDLRGDINIPYTGTPVLQLLIQQYHKYPKNFTPEKLEFMFQHGLNMKQTITSSSAMTYLPSQMNLEHLFTSGVPIDTYIEMLQIIKKYQK